MIFRWEKIEGERCSAALFENNMVFSETSADFCETKVIKKGGYGGLTGHFP